MSELICEHCREENAVFRRSSPDDLLPTICAKCYYAEKVTQWKYAYAGDNPSERRAWLRIIGYGSSSCSGQSRSPDDYVSHNDDGKVSTRAQALKKRHACIASGEDASTLTSARSAGGAGVVYLGPRNQ